jgi:hypothetical protein
MNTARANGSALSFARGAAARSQNTRYFTPGTSGNCGSNTSAPPATDHSPATDGFVERSVGSATHYHADYVAPYWAPRLAKIARIGAHIFYRWPGTWGSVAAFSGRYVGEPYDPASLRPLLRQAVLTDGTIVAEDPTVTGPPVPRAENDVGGLLDTSKGWTLNIPMPTESGTASNAVASQQTLPAEPAKPVALAARE